MDIKTIGINELKIGDSLIYHNKGFISFFIRLFTNSKYSHTSIVAAKGLVTEAVKEGYVARTIKESIKDAKEIIVKRPRVNFSDADLQTEIYKLLYARYEFEGLLYEAIKQVKPNSKWKGDKEIAKDVFCSKANAWIFWKVFKIKSYANWFEKTPRDIAEDFVNFDTYKLKII